MLSIILYIIFHDCDEAGAGMERGINLVTALDVPEEDIGSWPG